MTNENASLIGKANAVRNQNRMDRREPSEQWKKTVLEKISQMSSPNKEMWAIYYEDRTGEDPEQDAEKWNINLSLNLNGGLL